MRKIIPILVLFFVSMPFFASSADLVTITAKDFPDGRQVTLDITKEHKAYCDTECGKAHPDLTTEDQKAAKSSCLERCYKSVIYSKDSIIILIGNIANWFELIVLAIAVIMIIYGGAMYITAGGNEETAKKARKLITYALIGIAIALLAWGAESLVKSFLQM